MWKKAARAVEHLEGAAVIHDAGELRVRAPSSSGWVMLRATLVLPLLKLERELLSATVTGHQARQFEMALVMWEAGEKGALLAAVLRLLASLTEEEVER